MKYLLLTFSIIASITLISCSNGADSPRGFSLPEGDAQAGKAVFLKYQCLSCHTLKGVEQEGVHKNAEISVALGGETRKTITYAELVTSVINPSHKLASRYLMADVSTEGTSKMTVFNDVMTVTELVNLVAFLQPKYTLVPYQPTRYAYYPN
jgi:mono/diheme cytochrome c family protein